MADKKDRPKDHLNFWQLDFVNDTELTNLKADLDSSRRRLDSALFKHLALLAPVAVGGMGMFLRGFSDARLSMPMIAMVAVPAVILVVSVFLSAVSLAISPTNVVPTVNGHGAPILQSREDWVASLQKGALRTNFHRGFEDNVQFYGFALAALSFVIASIWALLV